MDNSRGASVTELAGDELYRRKLTDAGFKWVVYPWPSVSLEPGPASEPPSAEELLAACRGGAS